MKLIIGGLGQGMRAVALRQTGIPPARVADGAVCSVQEACRAPVVDNLHLLIRREMQAGRRPQAAVEEILACNPDAVLICQELGCGVVPSDAFERAWRDQTGQLCCLVAAQATSVERVLCGIPTVIKGE